MDDRVLRGFCQKCEHNIIYDLKDGPQHFQYDANLYEGSLAEPCFQCGCEKADPVWFLSPNQIYHISKSKEFVEWRKAYGSVWITPEDGLYVLSVLLESNPFLVAKILSDSVNEMGEKK